MVSKERQRYSSWPLTLRFASPSQTLLLLPPTDVITCSVSAYFIRNLKGIVNFETQWICCVLVSDFFSENSTLCLILFWYGTSYSFGYGSRIPRRWREANPFANVPKSHDIKKKVWSVQEGGWVHPDLSRSTTFFLFQLKDRPWYQGSFTI